MNVAVIGSGIIGLSCAWRLSQAGCQVTTFDGNRESQEASWTAAGMLAPHNEAKQPDALWSLCHESLLLWPEFQEELCDGPVKSSLDFHHHHSLIPCFSEAEKRQLHQKVEALKPHGVEFEWIDTAELLHREQQLSEQLIGAYRVAGGVVDPRKVCSALSLRCRELGVKTHFNTKVIGIDQQTIQLENGSTQHFDHIVLAAGAWTPQLAAWTGLQLQGQPVKGQMIRFQADRPKLTSHFIHSEHAYIVQRQDHSLVVGSTMENSGFDKADNPDAIKKLQQGALQLIPSLQQAHVSETWTGLRPKLRDGLPLFQRVNQHLTITSGHFRNGILLTPISAKLVTELVMDKAPSFALSDFQAALVTTAVLEA